MPQRTIDMLIDRNYPLLCRLFMAYFVAAYETTIQQCEEDGGKIVQELVVLLDQPFPEKCADLLCLLIFHLMHLHHTQEEEEDVSYINVL